MKKLFYILILPLFGSSLLFGWDGYDYNVGEYIEIDKNNLVREYEDIEVYHYGDGSYHDEEVQEIQGDELETFDYGTGEFHYYEMD